MLYARPIRTHISAKVAQRTVAELRRAGWSLETIAERSGLSHGTIARISSGAAARIEYRTAEAVASIA